MSTHNMLQAPILMSTHNMLQALILMSTDNMLSGINTKIPNQSVMNSLHFGMIWVLQISDQMQKLQKLPKIITRIP